MAYYGNVWHFCKKNVCPDPVWKPVIYGKITPPEKNNLWNMGSQSTEPGVESSLSLDCMTKVRAKGMFFSDTGMKHKRACKYGQFSN